MKPLTEQETFDKVYRHLLTQNKRAATINKDGKTRCLYRQRNLRCAVGCLIPDELYSPKMEDKSLCSDIMFEIMHKITSMPISDLRVLQLIHDFDPIEDWEFELTKFAEIRCLTVPADSNHE